MIKAASGPLLNNAGQAWNHAFFWHCMTPAYVPPKGAFPDLRDTFIDEGASHFGSGWVWIVADSKGGLKVASTHDGDSWVKHRETPVMVCDLWEHAYYLDYQNDRKAFLETFFDKLANWRFAENQLKAAKGEGEAFAFPLPEELSGQRKSA